MRVFMLVFHLFNDNETKSALSAIPQTHEVAGIECYGRTGGTELALGQEIGFYEA